MIKMTTFVYMCTFLWGILLLAYLVGHFFVDVCKSLWQHIFQDANGKCVFQPPFWGKGPVAQTLLIEVRKWWRGACQRTKPYRQVILTDDGQDLVLDWMQRHLQPRAVVLILHGLGTDCSQACYVKPWHEVPYTHAINIVVMNRRGHLSDHKLRPHPFLRMPSHADVEDVMIVIDQLNLDYPDIPIYIIGYSSGANHALYTAGTALVHNSHNVRGIVALSTAVDLSKMIAHLEASPVANRLLGFGAGQLYLNNPHIYNTPELKQAFQSMKITCMERAIARMQGLNRTLEEHWSHMSSLPHLQFITIPTLFVMSNDDPLIPPGTSQDVKAINNPNIQVITTKHGGHVGWFQGFRRKPFWAGIVEVLVEAALAGQLADATNAQDDEGGATSWGSSS